jgi:hypothetical protein
MYRHRCLVLRAAAVLTGLAALVLAPCGRAETPSDAAALDRQIIVYEAKAHSEVMANLTYLSDVIGPRLTGSPQLERANKWAAEKMRAYGLSNVHLEPWTIPVGWERGTATARIVEPENGRTLILAAMGWTPGTHGKIVGDVVVVKANNREELAAYKGKLKNAIVLRGAPANVRPITELGWSSFGGGGGPARRPQGQPAKPAEPGPEAKPAAPAKPAEPARADKPAEPERPNLGALRPDFAQRMAFQQELREFFRTEGVAAYLNDAGKPHDLLTMTGSWRGTDRGSQQEPVTSLFVAHEHYALLYRLATRPEPARTRLELEVSNKFIPGPITVYNTVGEIRGSEKPDEVVILGAHLDSWDLAQGTTDNGTGSMVVLEAARVLAKSGVRPKRTIRFILFTGEEEGLYGSREYVKQHKDELPNISAALVHDTGTGKVIGMSLQGREVLKPLLEKELAPLKDLGLKEFNVRGMFAGGSDHASFESVGVPGLLCQQDPAEYRLTHHSQSDTLDKAREPDLVQGTQVMAVAALQIANLPSLLPRDKPASAGPRRRFGDQPAEKPAEKPRADKPAEKPAAPDKK